MAEIIFRIAHDEDAGALAEITNYYIEKTVISFTYDPMPEQAMLDKIHKARKANMPFIVAADESGQVVGYITAGDFRDKIGYLHSIEITLFCRVNYTGQKIGSQLWQLFLSTIKDPKSYREFVPDADTFKTIRQIIAGMAIDTEGPRKGLALRDFYQNCGFVQTAHLPNVGYKFNRWIDVILMQYSVW